MSALYTQSLVEDIIKNKLLHGEVQTRQWQLDSIGIKYSTGIYRESGEMPWPHSENTVVLYINLKGKTNLHLPGTEKHVTINSGEAVLLYLKSSGCKISNSELQDEIFSVRFTKELFLQLAQGSAAIKQFTEGIAAMQTTVITPTLFIDANMQSVIHQINDCRMAGGLKKIYLYSKGLELLALYTEALNTAAQKTILHCKTDYDKERILYARDYLLEHVEMPPSLNELARISGINEFKLKHGFKELFDNTVFGYLADHRLELARRDIAAGGKTLTEIAFRLGYSSPQHFSAAFKKKFGVSAVSMRKK